MAYLILGAWFWAKWAFYHIIFAGIPVLFSFFVYRFFHSPEIAFGTLLITGWGSKFYSDYIGIYPLLSEGWARIYEASKNRQHLRTTTIMNDIPLEDIVGTPVHIDDGGAESSDD